MTRCWNKTYCLFAVEVDLPAPAEAKTHGVEVAREIVRHDEIGTRHWQLEIVHGDGATIATVPFATVDPSPDHLQADHRRLVERLCDTLRQLRETVFRSNLLATEPMGAGLTGRPRLVTRNGRRV